MKRTNYCACIWLAAVSLFVSPMLAQPPAVQPLHPEKWDEIKSFIYTTWPADVTEHPSNPYPFTRLLDHGRLFYYDFFFHNEGLLRLGYIDIARNNIDCRAYQLNTMGYIPNYISLDGENRSNPPVFTSAVHSFWEWTKASGDTAWLRKAYSAALIEYNFYVDKSRQDFEDHTTSIDGLQRYSHHETDTVQFNSFYNYVVKSRLRQQGSSDQKEIIATSSQLIAEAASGMDFTPRFEGRCMDYIAVDLNCLLYACEKHFASFERELRISNGKEWEKKARARAALINKYCWNAERGLYFDYDYVNGRQSPVATLAGLYPLFTGVASKAKAKRVRNNLSLFMCEGGLATCEVTDVKIQYQWGSNSVWGPLQQIAIGAMLRYGFRREAKDIATHWLNTVTKNYINPNPDLGKRKAGFVFEKYTRSGDINDDEYRCAELLGWSASAFIVALETVRKQGAVKPSK